MASRLENSNSQQFETEANDPDKWFMPALAFACAVNAVVIGGIIAHLPETTAPPSQASQGFENNSPGPLAVFEGHQGDVATTSTAPPPELPGPEVLPPYIASLFGK